MNKKIIFFSILLLSFCRTTAQNIFTLEDVIQRAKNQSPDSKAAETQKETSYWQYRQFKTGYNPRLVLSGNVPTYSRQYTAVQQPDGSIAYKPINQTNPGVNLGLEQPIWWTGGTISANTGLNYFNNLTSHSTQWSGQVMNIQLSQPLFAFNSFKWSKKIQPYIYEESRRAFVERSEAIANQVTAQFFDVLLQQINVQIAKFNLANNDTIYKIEQGRYNMGTTSKDKLLQVELQLLRSKRDVAQANLDLQTNSLRLRTFMGLKDGDEFRLIMPEGLPQFEVTAEEALQYAKQNRADFIAFERRRIEADRDVAQAKGSRFATSLNATYGLNNSAPFASDIYVSPQKQQRLDIGFTLPVLNWGRNHANMQTALAIKRLNDYQIAQDEVNFEQTITTQVLQFEMLRLQIEITKKADEVSQERYNVSQNRYLIGKIDVTNLNIALEEKDRAKRDYIQALKAFWTSYFDLRRYTLYDFATKQLLYNPD